MALQPIVDLHTGHVIAQEALLRGVPGTPGELPSALFAAADRLECRQWLEATARQLALARLAELPASQQLFLNIDTRFPELPVLPEASPLDPARVVCEISERHPIVDNDALIAQVRHWRTAGHRIALDDYGAGHMGPGAILTLEPDIVKLDRLLVADIDRDRKRQAIGASVVRLGIDLHFIVIAEGIETAGELAALQAIGVPYGQGFGIATPQRDPITTLSWPLCQRSAPFAQSPTGRERYAPTDPNPIP